ncbi:hypothetical protein G4B88_015959 [Cannabis sativa]|uniref:Uncharacterized protein n=1 Tax=Cannabis sativa TaxID=3483 RepID=A0A7J6ETU8_CANSA|nr:hypothetical protein G4B88_015959 [Cannabis sativa]
MESRRRSFNTYKKFKKEMNYEAKFVVVEDKDNGMHYYGRGIHSVKEKPSLGNDSNLRMKSCIAISGGSNPLEGKERPRIVAPILGYMELNNRQLANDLIELEMKDHDAALDMDWLSILLKFQNYTLLSSSSCSLPEVYTKSEFTFKFQYSASFLWKLSK